MSLITGRATNKVGSVPHAFDPGPVDQPFLTLARDYPGPETYPADAFRVEWGPIFHRGRLNGSARVLVIGQDPAASENVTRRILVGAAGHRVQGFLAKLGIDHSYVMINTFLYSVYGTFSGAHHKNDAAIIAYRNRWLAALTASARLEAVIALGQLADDAWSTFTAQAGTSIAALPYAHITHPTQPESSSGGDPQKLAEAIAALLANWNSALQHLHPAIAHPDTPRPLTLYGEAFATADLAEIPEADLPAGLPAWMRSPAAWAQRTGATAAEKRATITITVPSNC
jgi:Uracil DNA glycosylase superfamily